MCPALLPDVLTVVSSEPLVSLGMLLVTIIVSVNGVYPFGVSAGPLNFETIIGSHLSSVSSLTINGDRASILRKVRS